MLVDPALAGYWRIDEEDGNGLFYVAPDQKGHWWQVEMLAENCDEMNEESEFHAALTRIEGVLFLILTEDDSDLLFSVPIYDFLRAELTPDRLELRGLDEDWLTRQLETDAEAPSVIWREELSDNLLGSRTKLERTFILTASTPELRAFYGKHLDTEAAWSEVLPIVRLDESTVTKFRAARKDCER
jgi:hypothetical protein